MVLKKLQSVFNLLRNIGCRRSSKMLPLSFTINMDRAVFQRENSEDLLGNSSKCEPVLRYGQKPLSKFLQLNKGVIQYICFPLVFSRRRSKTACDYRRQKECR